MILKQESLPDLHRRRIDKDPFALRVETVEPQPPPAELLEVTMFNSAVTFFANKGERFVQIALINACVDDICAGQPPIRLYGAQRL